MQLRKQNVHGLLNDLSSSPEALQAPEGSSLMPGLAQALDRSVFMPLIGDKQFCSMTAEWFWTGVNRAWRQGLSCGYAWPNKPKTSQA